MAVRREHKQTDLEKRMKILNQQLYGKPSENLKIDKSEKTDTPSHRYTDIPTYQSTDSKTSDVLYLKRDLFKITILAGLAFGAQALLYIGLQNNYIRLPF